MKTIILAILAIALTGCAVPKEIKTQQKEETKALIKYHKAERKAYKANELFGFSKKALVTTTAAKTLADLEVIKSKKELDAVLGDK